MSETIRWLCHFSGKLGKTQGGNYAERILSPAEDAYDNQGGDATERQLNDIFVDGLLNDQLKMKIRGDQPDTLQGSVAVATNEQTLRARVQMSHYSQASITINQWKLTTLDVKGSSFRKGSIG